MSNACSSCSIQINSRQQKQSGLCLRCRKRKNAANNKTSENIYKATYNLTHKEQIAQKNAKWLERNRSHVNSRRRTYNKERYRTDISFKLRCVLRARFRDAVKNSSKAGSAVRDLGCSIEELKKHLELRFHPGMTWDNWKNNYDGWQVDHIVPLSYFDLSDREQLLKTCHYTNLQPLWGKDHKDKTTGDADVAQ